MSKRATSRLTYSQIGDDGEAWPKWIRALRGRSGVYVIRSCAGKVVYVGSSKGRLYDTITRHFQQWTRKKKWWSQAYGKGGHDPGVTYKRKTHELAVVICATADALVLEADLIERLKPRDNLVRAPDGRELDEVPF